MELAFGKNPIRQAEKQPKRQNLALHHRLAPLPTVVTRSKARRFRSHAIPTARRLSKLGQAWSAAEDPGQRVAAAVEGREAEPGVRLRSIVGIR
jgi:hypothetical protein